MTFFGSSITGGVGTVVAGAVGTGVPEDEVGEGVALRVGVTSGVEVGVALGVGSGPIP